MERVEREVKSPRCISNIFKSDISIMLRVCTVIVPFSRFCELSDWLSSQRRQVRLLRETAKNSSHQEQVDTAVQVRYHIIYAAVDLKG